MDSLSIPQNTSETLTEEADNIITTIGHSSGAETWMPQLLSQDKHSFFTCFIMLMTRKSKAMSCAQKSEGMMI